MAGSFGYEAEHVEVSKAMAELSLLPAVRAAPRDHLIVADGTSCRHQIRDLSGREALHSVRVLERALAEIVRRHETLRTRLASVGGEPAVPGPDLLGLRRTLVREEAREVDAEFAALSTRLEAGDALTPGDLAPLETAVLAQLKGRRVDPIGADSPPKFFRVTGGGKTVALGFGRVFLPGRPPVLTVRACQMR